MEDLMDDLHANSKLRPIVDDGEGDIPLWNKEIAKVRLPPLPLPSEETIHLVCLEN